MRVKLHSYSSDKPLSKYIEKLNNHGFNVKSIDSHWLDGSIHTVYYMDLSRIPDIREIIDIVGCEISITKCNYRVSAHSNVIEWMERENIYYMLTIMNEYGDVDDA